MPRLSSDPLVSSRILDRTRRIMTTFLWIQRKRTNFQSADSAQTRTVQPKDNEDERTLNSGNCYRVPTAVRCSTLNCVQIHVTMSLHFTWLILYIFETFWPVFYIFILQNNTKHSVRETFGRISTTDQGIRTKKMYDYIVLLRSLSRTHSQGFALLDRHQWGSSSFAHAAASVIRQLMPLPTAKTIHYEEASITAQAQILFNSYGNTPNIRTVNNEQNNEYIAFNTVCTDCVHLVTT